MTRPKWQPGSNVGPLPNFLVIGAMKAGTTSLYHYLRDHPEVFMSPIKELDFFVEEGNWKRGLRWYRKQFDGAGPALAVGEASTGYSKYPSVPGVPEKIATHLPNVRLIYVVRDPIDRIRSHYQHRVAIGAERAPIEHAVLNNPVYLNCSLYGAQVEQYLQYFSRNSLLLVSSEDLRALRLPTMRRVYEFLGVDSGYIPPSLGREYLRTSERATYSRATGVVRQALKNRLPSTKRAKELVDSVIPRSLSRIRGRQSAAVDSVPLTLPDALYSELANQLRDDVGRLRNYMDEGFDGWGIG